ncbi:hypothetical protein BJ878DRAFT_539528 [Calycina marina]|uniref:FAD-binding domain-containing protein n=1 Tax=Calycina marina TaxID=1763456 RepID=A0A9P8CHR6_9HELO|nr:hypothetical protein BJ878DRAFT_539528 [Calycina marina]
MAPARLKVVIIGGSVAGPTLCHTFASTNGLIDYTLLEGRDKFAPALGASILSMPNGARILDQSGLFDDLKRVGSEINTAITSKSDGEFLHKSEWPMLIRERLGYGIECFSRQNLLNVLHDRLEQKQKDKMFLNKRVFEIVDGDDAVTVRCADGSSYSGDIVIGADGIHSIVRKEMQRIAHQSKLGLMQVDEKGFFASKVDCKYTSPNIPRFTVADELRVIAEQGDFQFAPGVTLKMLFENTTQNTSLLALEEANFKYWSWGRMVCVGDSAHKMTPNIGQGGNQAIESAAALTNCLMEALSTSAQKPTLPALQAAFDKYQETRWERSKFFTNISGLTTRDHANAELHHTIRLLFMEPPSAESMTGCEGSGTWGCANFVKTAAFARPGLLDQGCLIMQVGV